ncbi:ABC drug exporter AtrF [Cordyceps fumosorosea ARSEF 2679]|uniref:ABC drug exporter AtrF n=1 Tax=Cordyceps fumosorosea (strain ARSEF 2679) TaxID=1081104 RepID=A0A162KCF7_CORFA|nr:ABC drug exporter AtrF [Cordyceps fumosorosea ARSEF 2679]OAA66038.1 ABC drug exporter AtrF [Cordyceps fumosorosea ARSEF 2679]
MAAEEQQTVPTTAAVGATTTTTTTTTTTNNTTTASATRTEATTAVIAPSTSADISSSDASVDGYWGDADASGPVRQESARQGYSELQKELSRRASHASAASKAKSHTTTAGGLFSSLRKSRREPDVEADSQETQHNNDDDFRLEEFMRQGHLEKRHPESGEATKKVGVVFKNLTVKGVAVSTATVRTLPQAILGTFGPDLYGHLTKLIPALRFGRGDGPEVRELIRDFTGVVRPGEMMLVLGRPGAGCSTFLKAIANNRETFVAVDGDVRYGGISAAEMDKRFRGEVVYNPEGDRHLPSLTVGQTLDFSLRTKTKKADRGSVGLVVDAFLKMFAIPHTKNTNVGDEYTRGVSGGERKRVSIAEALATKSTVACWDNSTRGLDASTALDYARSLRVMTDVSGRTTLTTLYQAGEGIYALFDKVLVIDDGRVLYQGPAGEARAYFEGLGFYAPPRQTTADFLTSVCDVNARRFRDGFDKSCPKTPAELEAAFRASDAHRTVLADVADYEAHLAATGHADAETFQQSVRAAKSRTVAARSSYTVSFVRQVLACTRREFWLLWGDKQTLYTKFAIIISMGLIVGSLFYDIPDDTAGLFLRGGAAFFSILFLGWLQLSELIRAIAGRDVIRRHREYAFYRPSAVTFARILADFPLLLLEVAVFGVILYFMCNLDLDAGKFFIYLLYIYTTTICITALYRMFAAISPSIDDAVRFSGITFNLLLIFTGYAISKPTLLSEKIWFGWFYWINPVSYAFEGVISNELSSRNMQCAPSQLVPQGPGIRPENQGCAVPGSAAGATTVNGADYLAANYDYHRSNLWRNWAVLIAFSVLYILVTVLATETISFATSGMGILIFKKSKAGSAAAAKKAKGGDEESGSKEAATGDDTLRRQITTPDEILQEFQRSEKIFTWEDVSYTVPSADGPKKLLNSVQGYAKPGVMVALMGASGAGKTTLLNTLSQRQTLGVVEGRMLVDGSALPADFQRGTGFVEQMDLHEESTTVREALEFSALLRQSRDTPRADKLAYVDKIIDLLEMQPIEDAIVFSLGVEQKKRLTIGVELAAKPSLLLFLDEPTSGLDSQSAFSIIRFLRKLCAAGQAIVCTIHQPSSELIEQFDQILALNPGGNVFYFGPVGENGAAVVDYFAARGAHCPAGKNVAEFLIEQGAKPAGRAFWNEQWLRSDENRRLTEEIARIKQDRSDVATRERQEGSAAAAKGDEFAASVYEQTALLTRRMFVKQWRQPSYVYGKFFVAVLIGIFNGFTFWQLGDTVEDMQSRMFTSFLVLLFLPATMNAVLPKFFMDRALWEAREYPSRIYGWVAFCSASIISEIPSAVVSAVLYWVLWYYATGLPTDSATAGFVFLMTLLFFLFQTSWAQWICAFAPSFTVISNVLPFFLVMFSIFNGVFVPYQQLVVFWRYWMYYVNPSTYFVGGVLSSTLASQPVRCADHEAAYFKPPSGKTCAEFASDFVTQAGRGYLIDPNATDMCGYCPYADGTQYLASLHIEPSQKWRDFGIFLAFCISNWALVYFFIYTVRVRRWSFGFGYLFKWF